MSVDFLIKFSTPSRASVKFNSFNFSNNLSLFVSLIKLAIAEMIKRDISVLLNENP